MRYDSCELAFTTAAACSTHFFNDFALHFQIIFYIGSQCFIFQKFLPLPKPMILIQILKQTFWQCNVSFRAYGGSAIQFSSLVAFHNTRGMNRDSDAMYSNNYQTEFN